MLKRITFVILCILVVLTSISSCQVLADDAVEAGPVSGVLSQSAVRLNSGKSPVLDATAAVLMDSVSGRVLFEKNSKSRKAIASTTKIMTAIVALENGRLDDSVTVSKRAASVWGSTVGLKEGQKATLRELLYCLLISSGNDAAIAIAEHISGSVEGFAEQMNDKAMEIGAIDTNFKTPHGLDANGHYSTAYDLALMTRYALCNEMFSHIVGTRKAVVLNKELVNTNEMLALYPGTDGVKTGYTGQAGRCLVTSVTRDNWRIISVVLGCPTRTKRAQSSKDILDYGFINYRTYTLCRQGEVIRELPVIKGRDGSAGIIADSEVILPLRTDEFEVLDKVVELPDNFYAPVIKDIEVGKMKIMLKNEVLAEVILKTDKSIEQKGVADYLREIYMEWVRIMHQGL